MSGTVPVDSFGMWESTAGLPEHVAAAAALGRSVPLTIERSFACVVVIGAGERAAAELLVAVGAATMAIPVVTVRSADLPSFVGRDTLVFALSSSGETGPTLAAAEQAWGRGATVIAVTGEGRLAGAAREAGSVVVPVPAGAPGGRGLAALTVSALVVLGRLGLLPDPGPSIVAATAQLRRRRDELLEPQNLALDIARRIGRTFPLVHGSPGLVGVAALVWKIQVNLNTKSPAFTAVHPELGYDEVAGWGQGGDVTRQVFTLVELRHRSEDPAIVRRFDLAREAMHEVVADVVPVWAEGDGPLAEFFDLVLIGDFVSLHLAAAEGVDPGPVPVVDEIERLADAR